SPLTAAIASYLAAHPPESGAGDIKTLLSTAPRRSTTYPPMLQLPADAFTSAPWSAYISAHPSFLPHLAHSLNVSHIVRLAPIAAASTIRAPGPGLTILHPENNDTTLWASATQHGIHQVWAPQHTMFSRGNITEKARVRALPRIAGKTVVDLYAGIGYFVFSHVAAGARRVYAWEINPWSVEGLVRGAARNGWRTRVVREDEAWTWGDDEAGVGAGGVGDGEGDGGVRIVVFQESNTHAVAKRGLPRGCAAHVNLGLLPSSRQGWETAAHLVDRKGGALHVHENVADTGEGIGEMRGVVVAEMRALVKAGDAGEEGGTGKGEGKVELEGVEVRCTHVQRVKTFAPGVVHAVFDIEVGA
ncbi:tRNA wybutosine-synthesizing protein 2, partial [Geopyxis carbonaria]